MPRPIFQFDLSKLEWCPKSLQDVADVIGEALESPFNLTDLEVIGTNHLDRIKISTDAGLNAWLQSEGEEQIAGRELEKVLRVTCPPRVLPLAFKPGEAPILAKGKRTASFDGDGRADARVVDFQLRIFDCGHFYMKQSLGAAHASSTPYWVIFEGRWRRSVRGYRLEFFFRYPRAAPGCIDFVLHGLPGRNAANLNFSGDQEIDLKGFLPTIVGNESSCWASLKSRPDKPQSLTNRNAAQSLSRTLGTENEDDEDGEEEGEEEEEDDALNQNQKQELVQSLMQELKPEQQQELRHALGKHGMSPELYSDLSPPLRQALSRLQRRAQIAARRRRYSSEGEPTWPMYLGLVLFVLVFVIFAYLWFEEHYGGDRPEDKDEDDYWKTDDFF